VWKPNVVGYACGCTCGCIVMLRRKLGMLYDPLWRPIRFSWAIIVFCVFNLCMHILYSEYILYITCYFCVTWLCIAWLVYSFHPTRVQGFGTRPPKRPTGVFIVPNRRFCHQVASPLAGWRPHGLTTLWNAQCVFFPGCDKAYKRSGKFSEIKGNIYSQNLIANVVFVS